MCYSLQIEQDKSLVVNFLGQLNSDSVLGTHMNHMGVCIFLLYHSLHTVAMHVFVLHDIGK